MKEQYINADNLKAVFNYLKNNSKVTSLTEFATLVGKNKSFISEILSGKRIPTPRIYRQIVEQICNTFPAVNENYLLTGEGEMIRTVTPDFCLMQPQEQTAPNWEDIIKEKDRIITEQASHIDSLKQSLNMNEKIIDLMSETMKIAIMGEGNELNKKATKVG